MAKGSTTSVTSSTTISDEEPADLEDFGVKNFLYGFN